MKTKTLLLFLIITVSSLNGIHAQDETFSLLKVITDKEYPRADVVVVYDSTMTDVQETGLSYVRLHKLTKVMTAAGAEENKVVKFDYDPLSAYVKVLSAAIYRSNGTLELLDSARIIDIPAPARAIYWGARQVVVNFGRLEPGDAVETVVFRKGFTYALLQRPDEDDKFIPPMKGHFYDIVEFWSTVPVKEKVYHLTLPATMDLQYEFYNGAATSFLHYVTNEKQEVVYVEPTRTLKASKAPVKNYIHSKSKKIYQWRCANIKPFRRERNMVALSDVAPKLLLSTTKTWYEKAVWFYKVNEDFGSFEYDEAIKKKTDELLKGVTDEMEQIAILTHWVAEEIRYSGISMGEGEGYTLHKGTMTFTDRCGVCKDKAGMLITMLRAAGYEAYAAMTMAGSRIDRIPADQFNHSVTVVKLKSGEWMLLDPTWVPGVRELWSSAEQQQGFLMGIPGGSDLMYTPVSPAQNHYWKLHAESAIDDNGQLTSTLTLEAEGQSDAGIRRVFGRSFLSGHEDYFTSLITAVYPNATISEYSYTDPYDLSKPMKMVMKIAVPGFAVISGKRMIVKPVAALNPFNDFVNASELYIDTALTERQYGFATRCSKWVEIKENIRLPDNYKLEWAPSFTPFESEAAAFDAQYSVNDRTLTLTARHSMHKRIYEPEEWNDFRKALLARFQLIHSNIILQQ